MDDSTFAAERSPGMALRTPVILSFNNRERTGEPQ
jgi:hypothetical protein